MTKVILFISQTDLVEYLQMPVNASNIKNFNLFTPKVYPRVCLVIWIIHQLQRTLIENAMINTIDTIDTINTIDTIDRTDCINQYEYNRYNWTDKLTLQTSPTQWHHCCLLFLFAWLIRVKIIVVLQSNVILLVRSPLLHILLLMWVPL